MEKVNQFFTLKSLSFVQNYKILSAHAANKAVELVYWRRCIYIYICHVKKYAQYVIYYSQYTMCNIYNFIYKTISLYKHNI